MLERLGVWLTSWVDRLPAGLQRWLPKQVVGFAMIGAFTLLIDLGLLWLLRTYTVLPEVAVISMSYATAFGLNFVINRSANFRSHGPVAGQALRWVLVVACDYGLTVGVTEGLHALGLYFFLSRILASGSVAVFTYTAARWWVFRDRAAKTGAAAPTVADSAVHSGH